MNTYHATSTAYTHRAETGAARYGIRTSRGVYPPVADFAPSHRNPHPMRYGDRLNIRLRFADGSENVINTDRVADLTELVGEVRQSARRRRGLVRMSVRSLLTHVNSLAQQLNTAVFRKPKDGWSVCLKACSHAYRSSLDWQA